MTSNLKKIISMILAGALMLICISLPCAALDSAAPCVAASSAKAGRGETVDVEIYLENNPGIVSMTLTVEYDTDALTLLSVTDAGVFGAQSHKPEMESPYTLVWCNDTATENFMVEGTIATLTFCVNEGAEEGASYPVKLSYSYKSYDIYDKDINRIEFVTADGAVEVVGSVEPPEPPVTEVLLGDINGDGSINGKDINDLKKAVAGNFVLTGNSFIAGNVYIDDKINGMDVNNLARYLAGAITGFN
ncbi:MAG: hypothetical protein IJA52_00275 [Clostridia bacterium]|nr:hypothetical protein [Clostridia bacterium]